MRSSATRPFGPPLFPMTKGAVAAAPAQTPPDHGPTEGSSSKKGLWLESTRNQKILKAHDSLRIFCFFFLTHTFFTKHNFLDPQKVISDKTTLMYFIMYTHIYTFCTIRTAISKGSCLNGLYRSRSESEGSIALRGKGEAKSLRRISNSLARGGRKIGLKRNFYS